MSVITRNGTKAAQKAPEDTVVKAVAVARRYVTRLERPIVAGVVAAVLAGGGVLLVTELAGEEYEGRVSLVAGPLAATEGAGAQYGEVVSFTLPALTELARAPSVLRAAAAETGTSAGDLADGVSVELVPASGLARVAVRASSAEVAGDAATAIAREMIKADLLAPAAALRLLDELPDVVRVAPDRPLGTGLALAAAAAAGVTVGALRHLRRTADETAVRAALPAGHPVRVLRADADDLPDRLALLCGAAERPAHVVATTTDLVPTAKALDKQLTRKTPAGRVDGTAVVAVTRAGQRRQDQLAAVAGVLPPSSVLVAVVLA